MKSMLKLPLIVLMFSLAMIASICFAGDAAGPTTYPANDVDWPGHGPIRKFAWVAPTRAKYWSLREQAQGSVVFAGDSLTQNWKDKDIARAFPDLKIANRGIGGDTSRGVLFRFQEDVLDLHPTAVVILAGGNDLTARGSAKDTLANIADMLAMVEKQNAETPVILCTVPPSDNPKAPVNSADRAAINVGLQKLASDHKQVTVCDLFSAVSNSDGSPMVECFGPDKLHLAAPGYAKWAEILMPIFSKLKIDQPSTK